MKAVIGALISVCISSVALAAADVKGSTDTDPKNETALDGNWKLAERVCAVGVGYPLERLEPTDGLNQASYDLQMNIFRSKVTLKGELKYFDGISEAVLNRGDHAIEFIIPYRNDGIRYRIEDDGSLSFIIWGDGHCGNAPQYFSLLLFNFVRERGE